jgi:inosine-uridine nucleoside N-ribohydrolase
MRPRIFLDVDPGHDDAFAILLASRTCDVVGLSSVSGNVGIEATTRNARIVSDLAGWTVPLYRGAAQALMGGPDVHAPEIHGASGMDGPVLPAPCHPVEPIDAARAIIAASLSFDDLWVVATGPLTNVALALRLDPGLAQRLAGISWMGGSATQGNVTAAAEFNAYADPEAAAEVFSSGARLVMVGLDLTHQFTLSNADVVRLAAVGRPAATFCSELLAFFLGRYQNRAERDGVPMHDPCAVMVLTDPHLFRREMVHVAIETRGDHTRGMTVVDRRGYRRGPAPNVELVVEIDAPAARERLHQELAAAGPIDAP